jgi:hypothetical protein
MGSKKYFMIVRYRTVGSSGGEGDYVINESTGFVQNGFD